MSKSPSLRRIQADVRELALDPSDRYQASPLENDMFEWHFTIRGADGTDFEGGVYHGRIMLPPEYPFKPPHIIFLTPSGRFETNTKVCLSFSAFHPELWQPAWGIRLILEALISFLPTPADGAIGALDWTSAERKKLAKKSVAFHCPTCRCSVVDLLPKLNTENKDSTASSSDASTEQGKQKQLRFQKEIEKLKKLQSLEHGDKSDTESKNTENKEETGEKNSSNNSEEITEKEEEPNAAATTTTEHDNTEPVLSDDQQIKDWGDHLISDGTDTSQNASKSSLQPTARDTNESPESTTTAPPAPRAMDLQPEIQPAAEPRPMLNQPVEHAGGAMSWMSDPILHAIIVLLSVLCYLLFQKFQALMEELRDLNEALEP